MAGESARELARRQREKAARLQRSAELWERGAEGERETAAALDALPKDSWTVFHDIRWPGRRFANVDHVVVGPPGVFVIDSKNWSGRVDVRDQVLRQNGRAREEAVAGAAEAALAIGALCTAVVPQHVFPVLCFVRGEELAGWARDVMVCSTANLVRMLGTRPEVLPPHVRQQACLWLDAQVRPAAGRATQRPTAWGATPRPTAFPRAAPAPRAKSGSRARTKKSSGVGGLVRFGLALLLVAVLLGSPQVLTGISNAVGRLFISEVVTTPSPPSPVEPAKKVKHPGRTPQRHASGATH